MELVLHILTNTIMPIFVLILLGAILGKTYDIHLPSLSKMYFNVLMPCFLFVNLYQAEITREMALAFLFAVLLFVLNYLVSTLVGRRLGMSREELSHQRSLILQLRQSGPSLDYPRLLRQLPVLRPYCPDHGDAFPEHREHLIGSTERGPLSAPDWRGLVARIIRMPSIWILPHHCCPGTACDSSQIPLLWTPAQYANSALVGVALVTQESS